MKTINGILLLIMIALVSCSGDEELVEKTQVQSQEAINIENQNLELWAARLNEDLKSRQKFISAVEGEYQGQIISEGEVWNIKVRLVPTMPATDHTRVRTLAELEYELQYQQVDAQILQWDPNLQISSVGCIFEDVRPDFKRGRLNIVSESCPNTYQITLQDGDSDDRLLGASVSSLISEDRIDMVEALQGQLQSNGNAQTVFFTLQRVFQ